MPVLTFRCASHLTPEGRAHYLHAITDPQDRNADIEERRIALRCAGVGHACRSSRQDQTSGTALTQLPDRCVEWQDLRVNREFAKASGDKLRVLRTEVENEDRLVGYRNACVVAAGRIGMCRYPDQMPLL